MARFDVIYSANYCTVRPHFCRLDNCFGSNEDCGYTLEEACSIVAEWYRSQASDWEHMIHIDAQRHKNN